MQEPDCTQSDQAPTVRIGLPEGPMRERLVRALVDAGVRVEGKRGNTPTELGQTGDDIVIVRRSQVSPELLEHIYSEEDDPTSPGWVVIGEAMDETNRAELISAGVTRVLDIEESPDHLAKTLQTLAEAEAAGGQTGPEGRGANAQPKLADFLSRNKSMRSFLDLVRKVSDADASIILTGETGVGKERLARAIHAQSPRCEEPFVAVNCGAFPENLVESELFGHEKGAFTGADSQRIGLFEQANKGTLFLDEIGELPMHLQVKLLTVLQRYEVRRVGGTEDIPIDVRVMAATNRRVQAEVDAGRFREDLYFRLNVIALDIPSLRERAEDIPDLVGGLIYHLCEAGTSQEVPTVSPEAMSALTQYSWPGNIRELINAIERALLLCTDSVIREENLPVSIRDETQPALRANAAESAQRGTDSAPFGLPDAWYALSIQDARSKATEWVEREYLHHLLTETQGHIANTAHRAGIGTRALYDRMKRYNLDKSHYKPTGGEDSDR